MKYIVELVFLVITLIYSGVIAWFFYSKEQEETEGTSLFSAMIVLDITSIILKIVSLLTIEYLGVDNLLTISVNKLSLASFLGFFFIFSLYVVSIGRVKKQMNFRIEREGTMYMRYFVIMIFALAVGCILFLDIDFFMNDKIIYPYGKSVDLVYFITLIVVALSILYILLNMKNIVQKRRVPILIFLVLIAIATIVQMNFPEISLAVSLETLVLFLMYHTVENPLGNNVERLEKEKEEALESNRSKSDFITSISHEVRTPLNVILGLSQDMETLELPKQAREDCEDVITASNSLLETVNNILDINEIEAETIKITKGAYNFKEDMEMLARVYTLRAKEKNLNFKYRISEDIPAELYGDRVHTKQIVSNLLSNAVKYTESGEIEFNIGCVNQGGVCDLIITVKDTGVGMKPEKAARLFSKAKLDFNKKTTAQGTKVGLIVTKRLVDLMGGRISLESQYGKGTTFMVNLPQKIVNASSAKPKDVTEKHFNNLYGSKKILIVDDNKLNIKVVRRALSDLNYEIDEAYDGREALTKVQSGYRYDLILMDIMMPNMNGEEALFELKKDPSFNTPVIALTADAISGSQEHYREVGFNDYLAKPFTKDQIKERIDNIFGN